MHGEQLTGACIELCLQRGRGSSITRIPVGSIDDIKALLAVAGAAICTTGGCKRVIVVPSQHFPIGPNTVVGEGHERLVQQILQTLFTCKCLILVDYVKCIIHHVSVVHTIVLYHLPAKAFYESMVQYTTTA
jgi:hypothetical protein